jgi:predicted ATP-dependent protease
VAAYLEDVSQTNWVDKSKEAVEKIVEIAQRPSQDKNLSTIKLEQIWKNAEKAA